MSNYPVGLPGPVRASHTPKPRNAVTDVQGPASYANRERDFTRTMEVEFFFTAEQADAFYVWWRDDLAYGGRWFNCEWPSLCPGPMVVQLVGEPSFDHVYNGAHRISMSVVVRGSSLPISTCLLDPYYNGPAGDPYFASVVLLLHGEGANGGTTFVDSSSYARTPSLASGCVTTATDPKFGTACIDCTTFGGNIEYASSEDFGLQLVYTIEFWIKTLAGSGSYYLLANSASRYLNVNDTGTTVSFTGWASAGVASGIVPGVWTHVANSRDSSGVTRTFVNGVQTSTATNAAVSLTASVFGIMDVPARADLQAFNGQLDDVRYTQGVCRYTGNFVVPTSAYPDSVPNGLDPYWAKTVLLLNGEKPVDFSPKRKTITLWGGAVLSTADKQFGSKSFFCDATASSYIDCGFVSPDSSMTGDFTFEFWAKEPAPQNQYWWSTNGPLAMENGYISGFGETLSYGAIAVPVWTHFALSRSSGTVRVFRGGILQSEWPNASTVNFAGLQFCRYVSSGINFKTAYIDDVRITKDVARYTAGFSVPTAPNSYYAYEQTVLSLHGESLLDSSTPQKTVTNLGAALSSTQKRFGASAIYFAGGTARLRVSQVDALIFGAEDFTLEAWVFPLATTAQRILVRSESGGVYPYSLAISSVGKFSFFCCNSGSSVITISSSVSVVANQWWHLLAVRSGSSFYLFVDGVLEGSGTFTGALVENGVPLSIGAYNGGSEAFNGYIDDLRITRGVARNLVAFTPPAITFCDRA